MTVAVARSQQEITKNWGTEPTPLVSVCCITFNHVCFIKDAIDSFLMQESNFPFEIILHDDASTDGTTDIVKDYSARYPAIIKSITQAENQFSRGGLINPRLVFPKAKGKYIALCEGDDYWIDKQKLQKQVSFLEANPDYVIAYTDCQPFDEEGEVNADFGGARRDLESIELKKATPIFTLTACFRNVIKDIPQDVMAARFGDLVLWSLLGQHGKGKYLSDVSPSMYRVHDGGIFSKKSTSNKYEMDVITKAALLAYWQRVGDEELCEFYKKEVLKSSIISLGLVQSINAIYTLCVNGLVFLCKSVSTMKSKLGQ
jgi:glycosyltransferase involved in cell wall biosynthesis